MLLETSPRPLRFPPEAEAFIRKEVADRLLPVHPKEVADRLLPAHPISRDDVAPNSEGARDDSTLASAEVMGGGEFVAETAAAALAQRRIVFSDVCPKVMHLSRLEHVADIFLDTPLCNAHTGMFGLTLYRSGSISKLAL